MGRNTNSTEAWARPEVTIANGAAVSTPVNIREVELRGLAVVVPDEWTDADLGVQVAEVVDDNTTPAEEDWIPCRDDSGNVIRAVISKTDELSQYLFGPSAWSVGAWHRLRVVSINASAPTTDFTPVNQGAARTLTLVFLF